MSDVNQTMEKKTRGRPRKERSKSEEERLQVRHKIWAKGKLLIPVNLGGHEVLIEAVKMSVDAAVLKLPMSAIHKIDFATPSRGSAKGKKVLKTSEAA